jgi:hypothetical protein
MAAALAVSFSAAPAHAQPTVTFSGNFTGNIVSRGPGRCGPGRLTFDLTVSGFLSPFGAATGTQSACNVPGTFSFFDGLFSLTFVGGATLFGTYHGTLTPIAPPLFQGNSTLTITGGTGIFAGATGGGTSTGTQNFATGTVVFQPTGTVSAPGLVPEPSTFALLAAGLAAVAAIGRARPRRRDAT